MRFRKQAAANSHNFRSVALPERKRWAASESAHASHSASVIARAAFSLSLDDAPPPRRRGYLPHARGCRGGGLALGNPPGGPLWA